MKQQRKNELLGFACLAIGALVFVSLLTYDPDDLRLFASTPNTHPHNFIGIIGAYIGTALFFLIGKAAFVIPLLCLIWAVNKFTSQDTQKLYIKIAGTTVLFLSTSAFLSLSFNGSDAARMGGGGVCGVFLSAILERYSGTVGAFIITALLMVLSLVLATEFLVIPFVTFCFSKIKAILLSIREYYARIRKPRLQIRVGREPRQIQKKGLLQRPARPSVKPGVNDSDLETKIPRSAKPKIRIETTKFPRPFAKDKKPAEKAEPKPKKIAAEALGDYKLPTVDLLDVPPPIEEGKLKGDLAASSAILEETLQDFGIDAKVTEVEKGPVITRYELEPSPGVKVNRITALSDDIALAMKAPTVRIIAPIPGKARVGIEVPNTILSLVYLRDVLSCKEFQGAKSKLTLALGKDTAGVPVTCVLDKMPHLLIAGTTGSGKTVCVNSIILSMLFNCTPDELKLILIDPKMVELLPFNKIPHLICPVVTDAKKASAGLGWVVNEMESRYKLFARLGTRNIEIYNQRHREGKFKDEDNVPGKLPFIVVVIDELADLMTVASQEVEYAIGRLAQLSRAVGIHIILATQRPSVDVITGVIKANFPARISFKVASKVDSRTVLDMNGADRLLGRGDMLFLEPGAAKPTRAQCSFVSDKEIERVVDFIASQRKADYEESVLKAQDKKSLGTQHAKDECYDEAVKLILSSGQASVSILQRRMRLSYTRAARIIDSMEEEGLVGPYRGSKAREILVDPEAYLSNSEELQESSQ